MNNLNLKKQISFSFFFFLFMAISISQDVITTQDGEEIECKVLEIDLPKVKYRLKTQPNGPIRNIEVVNIFMIKYADGSKELFKDIKEKQGKNKQASTSVRAYKPFSIGIGSGLGFSSSQLQSGSILSFGYELKPVNLRFLVDGTVYTNFRTALLSFNFNLQYLFKIADGKLEVFPELGIGVLYYGGIRGAVVNVGAGLDYRTSNVVSFFVHPRYQISFGGTGGSFILSLGARFRFGGNKEKQEN